MAMLLKNEIIGIKIFEISIESPCWLILEFARSRQQIPLSFYMIAGLRLQNISIGSELGGYPCRHNAAGETGNRTFFTVL